MRRVLVAGATGFVGQHLCPALLDIGTETEWTGLLQEVDYVVHLATLPTALGPKTTTCKKPSST